MNGKINDTQGVVLGFLSQDNLTAGQIYRGAEIKLAGFFSVTRSQIHRELHKLAELGHVKAVGKPGPRKVQPYRITAKGKKAYALWMEELGRILIRDGVKLRSYLASLG